MNVLTKDSFNKMRAENPGASPAILFDKACEGLGSSATWATSSWRVCSDWMDLFATVNPYSSCAVH